MAVLPSAPFSRKAQKCHCAQIVLTIHSEWTCFDLLSMNFSQSKICPTQSVRFMPRSLPWQRRKWHKLFCFDSEKKKISVWEKNILLRRRLTSIAIREKLDQYWQFISLPIWPICIFIVWPTKTHTMHSKILSVGYTSVCQISILSVIIGVLLLYLVFDCYPVKAKRFWVCFCRTYVFHQNIRCVILCVINILRSVLTMFSI
mgnify:CR=1 FL=1